MHPDAEIAPKERAVYRDLADGAGGVLLHLDTAAYHGVNEIGALIWEMLGDGTNFATLVERVRGELLEEPDTLEDDVAQFVEALRQRDLVEVRASDRSTP